MLTIAILCIRVNFIRKTTHGIFSSTEIVGISQSNSILKNIIGEMFIGHQEFEESDMTSFAILQLLRKNIEQVIFRQGCSLKSKHLPQSSELPQ